MSANIFLPRPSRFDTYFELAEKEFLDSAISGDNLQVPNLLSQLSPTLTYKELIQGVSPDKNKSFVDNGEVILCNSSNKILYKMQIEKKLF